MSVESAAPDLGALLGEHREEIAAAWAELLRALPVPAYGRMDLNELRAATRRTTAWIVQVLKTGDCALPQGELADTMVDRLEAGFDIGELTQAGLLFKKAAFPIIRRHLSLDSDAAWDALAHLDECLAEVVAQQNRWYAEEMTRQLRQQQERTGLLLDTLQTASSSLELDEVLRDVARGLTEAVGVPHCGFLVWDEESQLLKPRLRFDAVPVGSGVAAAFMDEPRDSASSALLRHVLVHKEPAACSYADSDPRANQNLVRRLGVKSVMAVPIVHKGQVLAVAMLSTLDEYHEFTEQEVELAWGLANSAALAISNARLHEEVRERLAEIEAIQRVASVLLQPASLDEVLTIVCSEAERLTGARGSTVFLVEDDSWLEVAVSTGEGKLLAKRLPVERSLAGHAVRSGEPLLSNDVAKEDGVYRHGAVPTTLLVVPLTLQGSPVGALGVTNKPDGFSQRDVRIISIFADQATIAIEHARLHREEQQRAILEERGRLAREMHDGLAQELATLHLRSGLIARMLSAGQIDEAQAGLQELRRTTLEAHADLREAMLSLRTPVSLEAGFWAALQEYVTEYDSYYDLHVQLEVDDDFMPCFSPDVELQVWRIIQEALINVRKHAEASAVAIRVERADGQVRICVEDDGRGFDFDQARGDGQPSFGLQVMRERAESVGGSLQLHSRPGQGMRVVVSVPCSLDR